MKRYIYIEKKEEINLFDLNKIYSNYCKNYIFNINPGTIIEFEVNKNKEQYINSLKLHKVLE